jgi:F-type H+-transporting ATPase subunit b
MEYQAFHAIPWEHGSFWVLVAIVIFLVLAGRKILSALLAMLDGRAEAIRAALEEAERLKTEAAALLEDAQAAQAQAVEDAKQILNSAAQEAAYMAAGLAAEAEATAKRREQMAMERIAAAEKSAVQEVRAVAIDIATAAAAKLLQDGMAPGADAAMIDVAIAGVPKALRQPTV